ncbi:MAG: hypothetical protein QXO24_01985 [Candidatus Micrarchaeaceae archaeon]
MKRPRILTFVAILLALLAAFRNVSASQNGETRFQTSSADILPTPTPPVPKGTPPQKTTTRPPSTKPASGQNVSRVRRVNLGRQSAQMPRQPTGDWQLIYSDGFETGNWPYSPWTVTDLSQDGYDRKWGRSNYWGFWGLWPAAGGTHSTYPPTQYPNNMHTRMRYGPFDLRDATWVALDFWLWRDIEDCCDYLVFEASGDGSSFQELGRWTGYVEDWQQPVFYLDQYAGQSQVWVAWRFYSNDSITYAGPWVDDVEIWKYVPGQVTVQGYVYYFDRNGARVPAQYATVHLWDANTNGVDYELAYPTTTNQNGFFQFPTTRNWEYWDSDDPDHALDLYIVVEAIYNDSASSTHQVTNIPGDTYQWRRGTSNNVPDGIVDLSYDVPINDPSRPAMWIFQDLRRAWEFVWNNTNPHADPGSATTYWEAGRDSLFPCSRSCFYVAVGGSYVFIADGDRNSPDQVIHEVGHQYTHNATQWWWWNPICAMTHNIFVQTDVNCAWSEGWAYFFPLPVNGDPCIDFGAGSCGTNNVPFENLETPTWGDNRPQGHAVEGRVSGALYDLFDNVNEGPFDSATFGFAPIWNIIRNAPTETTFREFWNSWRASGNNQHHAVRAIYQNTIDYDTAPRFNQLLPDRTVLQNFVWNQAIDLWAHSEDDESADAELTWQIIAVTDARCGVSLSPDSRYVNIAPQQGWLGSCDVTIRVSDSIKTADDTFRVDVVPVRGRIYLPIILK